MASKYSTLKVMNQSSASDQTFFTTIVDFLASGTDDTTGAFLHTVIADKQSMLIFGHLKQWLFNSKNNITRIVGPI